MWLLLRFCLGDRQHYVPNSIQCRIFHHLSYRLGFAGGRRGHLPEIVGLLSLRSFSPVVSLSVQVSRSEPQEKQQKTYKSKLVCISIVFIKISVHVNVFHMHWYLIYVFIDTMYNFCYRLPDRKYILININHNYGSDALVSDWCLIDGKDTPYINDPMSNRRRSECIWSLDHPLIILLHSAPQGAAGHPLDHHERHLHDPEQHRISQLPQWSHVVDWLYLAPYKVPRATQTIQGCQGSIFILDVFFAIFRLSEQTNKQKMNNTET